jgi:hypothetical protein
MTPVGVGEMSGSALARGRASAGFRRPSGGLRYLAATALFVFAFAIWLHPVALHPGSRLPHGFNDATTAIRFNWAAAAQHRDPLTFTHDRLEGAPEGLALSPAAGISGSVIQTGFIWELNRVFNTILVWNLFIFIGFIASGLAMFALLDCLGCTFGAALFGGYVFAFNPYTFERVYAGHFAYLQNWVFVALIGAVFYMRERRSLLSVVLLGAGIALTFYMAAYDALFGGVIVVVFGLVEWARLPARRDRLRTIALTASAFAVSVIALLPVFVMYTHDRSTVQTSTAHAGSDLYLFAARPSAYLLPSPRNPLFHWLRGFHPTDLTEETLFFGYTTFALAVVAVLMLRRRAPWFAASESRRWTMIFFVALGAASFVLSLPPSYKIGKVVLPMPSLFIGVSTSFWRVYSRFGLIVGLSLIVLASCALTALAQRRGARWQYLAPAVLAFVALVELLPGNVAPLDTNAHPAWVDWLARAPRGIVATYPIAVSQPAALNLVQEDFWYQRTDHQPRFQFVDLGPLLYHGRANSFRVLARNIGDPLTPKILATEGVRYVVLHDDVYRAIGQAPPNPNPLSYTLLARFSNVAIYSVHAPHVNLGATFESHRGGLAKFENVPVSVLK